MTAPRRSELWELTDGRMFLALQRDSLNTELPTLVGLVVTRSPQRAPEPVRVALSEGDTSTGEDLWVKIPLVVTIDREALSQGFGQIRIDAMSRVEEALKRVLDLDQE